MSGRVVYLRADHGTIADLAVGLAVEAAGQLTEHQTRSFNELVRGAVGDGERYRAIIDESHGVRTEAMEHAGRLGFFLGLTMTTHGIIGDRAWMAEALRLAGEAVDVEYRAPAGRPQ